MTGKEIVSLLPLSLACLFFLAGTVGLLRFPDTRSRVHALTKADNLGLGLLTLALLFCADSVWVSLKLIGIWFMALVASSTNGYLIARRKVADVRARRGE